MLTEKQEQAIKDKIEFVRIRAERNEPDFSRIAKWIVAGIKAYDEIRDVEGVKAAAKAAEAESNDSGSGAYVVFRPSCLTIEESMQKVRVFNSIEEMVTKLKEEKQANIYIEGEEHEEGWTRWQHCQYVLYGSESFRLHAGICDCKTFKRG